MNSPVTFCSIPIKILTGASIAKKLIEWVKTTPKWPKYIVHGATITTEQGDGKEYCCNDPGQCCDSHTARLAAVEALYYAKTGDVAYRDEAYRSYNWVTYFQGYLRRRTVPLPRSGGLPMSSPTVRAA